MNNSRGVSSVVFLLVLTLIFSVGFVSAATTLDDLHLNIQVTDGTGKVETGTFNFKFDITTNQTCSDVVYTKSESLTTDVRGIISYYLDATNLDYDEQYYLCYYRDDMVTPVETMQIARAPYAFRAKFVNVSGIQIDSNLNLGGFNLSANYLFGDGSGLTNIQAGSLNLSQVNFWGKTAANELFYNEANVGIGTDNPSAKLDVIAPNGDSSSLRLGRLDNANYWDFNHAGNDLRIFNTAGSGSNILLGVDSSGSLYGNNVGIGTTTPSQKLEVNGSLKLISDTASSGRFLATSVYNGKNYETIIESINGMMYITNKNVDDGNLGRILLTSEGTIRSYSDGTQDLGASSVRWRSVFSDNLYVTNNVGIGTNSPGSKLDVSGNVTAYHYFGSGRYLTDLNVDAINLSAYYQKIDVYNKGETFNKSQITGFLGSVVPYVGASSAVNLGSQNVSAGYYFGDGRFLTNLNLSALDMGAYYNKSDVYNKSESVPYIGATQNVDVGSQNVSARYFLGSGRYLTDLDVNGLDLSEYYKKVQVYNQTEIDSFNSNFVTYNSSTSNVDLGANDITASHFIGDGSQLTNLTIDESTVNYWGKNGQRVYYNDGNVGIGTDSPLTKLDINNNRPSSSDGVSEGYGDLFIMNENITGANQGGSIVFGSKYLGQSSRAAKVAVIKGANDIWANSGAGNLQFYTSAQGGANNLQERMRIDSSGRIGIGTASPDSKLHIYDAINSVALKIEADGADDNAEILIDRAVNTQRANLKFTTNDALDWSIGTLYNAGASNSDFSISPSNSLANAVFTINPSGQIGIGTTNPSGTLLLDVEGNIGAQAICDENGANCIDVSSIEASVNNNPVVGFFSHTVIFSMDYSTGGIRPAALTASQDFCGNTEYLGVIKQDGTRTSISTPFGGTCTTQTLVSDNTQAIKWLVWNHASDRFYFRYDTATITADEQTVGFYFYEINKFQWLVDVNSFRFGQTNNLNMGGNNIALNGGYLSGDGGDEGISVDSAGNVGIGKIVNRGNKLEVNGIVSVDSAGGYRMYNSAGTGWAEINFDEASNHIQIQRGIESSDDAFRIAMSGGNSYLNVNGGNVGIGTTNPSKTLSVVGEINVTTADNDISMFMENGALVVSG